MQPPQTHRRSPREMRRHCRVEGNWRLIYEVDGRTHKTSVANLSRGGMFVRSGRGLVVGQTYTFRLHLTDDQAPLKIRGVVLARVKGNRGGSHHARVQFVPRQNAAVTRLREFMLETVLPSLETELRKTMRAPARAASLAELRAELGDWPAAIALYRRSLALNPKSQALHERAVVFFLTALESGTLDPRPALVEAENALRAGQRLGASSILDAAAEELAAADRQVAEHDQPKQQSFEPAQQAATEAEQRLGDPPVQIEELAQQRQQLERALGGQREQETRARTLAEQQVHIAEKEERAFLRQNRAMAAAQGVASADRQQHRNLGVWAGAGFAAVALVMVAAVLYLVSSKGSAPDESAVTARPPGRPGTQLAPSASGGTENLLAQPVGDGRGVPQERGDGDTPVRGKQEHTVAPGETLSSIAQKQYGVFELWPVILAGNLSELDDPNRLEIGTRLVVPTLEGSAVDLSDHDRELVAAGYETVSRYYQSRSARRAAFYGRWAARYRAGQSAVLRVTPKR